MLGSGTTKALEDGKSMMLGGKTSTTVGIGMVTTLGGGLTTMLGGTGGAAIVDSGDTAWCSGRGRYGSLRGRDLVLHQHEPIV